MNEMNVSLETFMRMLREDMMNNDAMAVEIFFRDVDFELSIKPVGNVYIKNPELRMSKRGVVHIEEKPLSKTNGADESKIMFKMDDVENFKYYDINGESMYSIEVTSSRAKVVYCISFVDNA